MSGKDNAAKGKRWHPSGEAAKCVTSLIQHGAIDEVSIDDESYMRVLHAKNEQTSSFPFERFLRDAHEKLGKKGKAVQNFGEYLCFVIFHSLSSTSHDLPCLCSSCQACDGLRRCSPIVVNFLRRSVGRLSRQVSSAHSISCDSRRGVYQLFSHACRQERLAR